MPKLLVIDTSSSVCTVVLILDTGQAVKQLTGARSHGQFLLGAIDEVIAQSEIDLKDLDAIAVVSGPGSFTGIRIGIGVVQGLATALGIQVILLSSLEWLAFTALKKYDCSRALVCCTARDSEYYCGYYKVNNESVLQPVGGEKVAKADCIEIPESEAADRLIGVGDGWKDSEKFDPQLVARCSEIDVELTGSVSALCELSEQAWLANRCVPADAAIPNYLKENMNYKTST